MDGVLYNWHDAVVTIFNTYLLRGEKLAKYGEEGCPEWNTLEKLAPDAWHYMWNKDDDLLRKSFSIGSPFSGVPAAFDKLNKKSVTYIITCRPKRVVESTYEWCRFHDIKPSGIIHVDKWNKKRAVIEALELTHFIDDKVETILDMNENSKVESYIKDGKHNRNIDFPRRVKSFGEFVDRITSERSEANKPQG